MYKREMIYLPSYHLRALKSLLLGVPAWGLKKGGKRDSEKSSGSKETLIFQIFTICLFTNLKLRNYNINKENIEMEKRRVVNDKSSLSFSSWSLTGTYHWPFLY